jgi:hypothetical protein
MACEEGSLHPGSGARRNRASQSRTGGNPGGNAAEAAQRLQGAGALVNIKSAQILAHDLGHGHAHGGGEILFRHLLLALR